MAYCTQHHNITCFDVLNASFVRLSYAHSGDASGLPVLCCLSPALLSCSSPLSGAPLRAHCAPKADYCPKVKLVPWVGV